MSTHLHCLEAETEALGEQDIWNTLAVMIYELGAVSQSLILIKTQDEKAKNGLYANAVTEIGDLVTQCGLLFTKVLELAPHMELRPSWGGLVQMGISRQLERMKTYEAKEPRHPSINEG